MGAPLAVNPAPEMLTFEIVVLPDPDAVRVTVKLLLVPTVTFPKVRLEGVQLIAGVPLGPDVPEDAVTVMLHTDTVPTRE